MVAIRPHSGWPGSCNHQSPVGPLHIFIKISFGRGCGLLHQVGLRPPFGFEGPTTWMSCITHKIHYIVTIRSPLESDSLLTCAAAASYICCFYGCSWKSGIAFHSKVTYCWHIMCWLPLLYCITWWHVHASYNAFHNLHLFCRIRTASNVCCAVTC